MSTLATIFVLIVSLEHFYILALEMFFLSSKAAKRSFGLSDEAVASKQIQTLFANQGLYNGFLATGLIFGLIRNDTGVIIFFLSCVIIAAVYGALTSNRSILIKQGFPAIIALILVLLV
ncbi:DUF1304 domain-containing protein [Planococcus glaciei]|uniref:DUF1304 domain-containing protein n=1 Tax=Planococcus glaciei TaxID=459472 RepID=A0A7H8QG17_9BACL|nr:DUF1304 domain-containing protein [Planococcus glaciei]ETP69870.1 membrane protein [Planococcus glaciei CHR43]MBX0314149.1 DUF1304 domain-containing protein [Planococcus glaciei]QKX52173.1 DUF1304 domain-containing protein [Planococcus glaciei]